jgi:drug/metabolite transporter (DMT)-like permease
MPAFSYRNNYRLGSLLSLTTALLLATQEPFSALAAKHLNFVQFVFLTQCALLLSVPFLTISRSSRRDFITVLKDYTGYWKLVVVFLIGMSGLTLYNLGLGKTHPIIIAAILNLSPFWAALVALLISRKRIAVPLTIFYGCLVGAFFGAMAVAWSQMGGDEKPSIGELIDNIRHGSWFYAIPIPLLSALGGNVDRKMVCALR